MKQKSAPIYERIYAVVKEIPAGFVATYGDVAQLVGTSPRVVGNAMHANPYEGVVPCHRIVNASGKLAHEFAFGGFPEQERRLASEGVDITNRTVDLSRYRYQFNSKISAR